MKKYRAILILKKIKIKFILQGFHHKIGLKKDPILKYINYFEIQKIVDVGANIGQFATRINALGYKNEIHSFEPMEHESNLLKRFSKNNKKWFIYNFGIGENYEEQKKIYVSKNSVSSSLLKVNNEHLMAAPKSIQKEVKEINLLSLENALISQINLRKKDPIFLKIDVQGYEMPILRNFEFEKFEIPLILIEASFTKLYKNQEGFNQLINLLYDNNYTIVEMLDSFRSRNKIRNILQTDLVLCRNNYLRKIPYES